MGLVRLILALSVVLFHTGMPGLVGGRNAVQIFFIISGFLMSFVLVEQKKYKFASDFYFSRFIKLYPAYYFVFILTLVFYMAFPRSTPAISFFSLYDNWQSALFLVVANLTLFFQDVACFLKVWMGGLVFITSPGDALVPGLVVPPAWSLSIEIIFYLLSPFFIHSKKKIIALFILSIVVRFTLINFGYSKDPWNCRFFANEIGFFLLGVMSHQIVWPFYKKFDIKKSFFVIATLLYLATIVFYEFIGLPGMYKDLGLILFSALVMPFIFEFQNSNSWDKFAGDLSYPIYLLNILVISVFDYFTPDVRLISGWALTAFVFIFSIAGSIFIIKYIERPAAKALSKLKRDGK